MGKVAATMLAMLALAPLGVRAWDEGQERALASVDTLFYDGPNAEGEYCVWDQPRRYWQYGGFSYTCGRSRGDVLRAWRDARGEYDAYLAYYDTNIAGRPAGHVRVCNAHTLPGTMGNASFMACSGGPEDARHDGAFEQTMRTTGYINSTWSAWNGAVVATQTNAIQVRVYNSGEAVRERCTPPAGTSICFMPGGE